MTKSEAQNGATKGTAGSVRGSDLDFELLSSFGFRHSSFQNYWRVLTHTQILLSSEPAFPSTPKENENGSPYDAREQALVPIRASCRTNATARGGDSTAGKPHAGSPAPSEI